MKRKSQLHLLVLIFMISFGMSAKADPLPSWQAGAVKDSILQFVHEVTDQAGPNYVPPAHRIATFDNDGTLWVEQPAYTQVIYMFNRVKQLSPQHPEWKEQPPFNVILSGDRKALASLTMQEYEEAIAATHAGMTVDAFIQSVQDWLATAKSPRFNRPYTELIYQPMREVMRYLRANQFKIYIVSGGGQEFVRAFAERIYDVPTDAVIGTATKTKYTYQGNQPVLIKMPAMLFIDDKFGKPEAINLFIGRKPIIAFGNSDGDREMLEWTQSGTGKRLMLLVHHDDAKREYAYGPQSKVGTFSASLMEEAKKNKWQIISMKKDWKFIFPFERK
ncbi:MAG: haloacid dehalogenase-like hydrolase [Gammaproteobacteria bacterium]|nr:haloacid dehalogenase-like hydrolase [Gammaproteobacteria bacterium]